eukprot:2152558-Heterocapsa_arctica.AAC.1
MCIRDSTPTLQAASLVTARLALRQLQPRGATRCDILQGQFIECDVIKLVATWRAADCGARARCCGLTT